MIYSVKMWLYSYLFSSGSNNYKNIFLYPICIYICVSGVAPCHHMFTSNKRMHAVMQNLISAICVVFLCLYAFFSHPRVPCTSASPPTTQLWSCVQERKMLEALTCNWFASTSRLSVAEVVCLHWLLTPYSPSTPSPTPLFVAGGGAS